MDYCCWFWFVWFILPRCDSLQPESLRRPGALVHQSGTVAVVEDVLNLRIVLKPLYSIMREIPDVEETLERCQEVIQRLQVKQAYMAPTTYGRLDTTKIISIIKLKLLYAHQALGSIGRALPWQDISDKRSKRGLFNLGGMVLGTVFGLSTEDQVLALEKKVDALDTKLENQDRILTWHNEILEEVLQYFSAMNNQSRYMLDIVTSLNRNLYYVYDLMTLSDHISIVQLTIQALSSSVSSLIDMLIAASRGHVTSDLIKPQSLLEAIHWAQRNLSLTPLFPDKETEFYYPLLETTITDQEIIVHVPFQSLNSFNLFEITPFPVHINNSLYTVSLSSEIVLVSSSLMHASVLSPSSLLTCHKSFYHIYLCPAYLFTVVPAESLPCEMALVRNESVMQKCSFVPTKVDVYKKHVHVWQYLYFDKATSVTFSCPNRPITHAQIVGTYIVPDFCSTQSNIVATLPSRHHEGLVTEILPDLVPLPEISLDDFQNISVISEPVTFSDIKVPLKEYGRVKQQLIYPTIGASSLIFVIIIVTFICYIIKLSRDISHLQQIAIDHLKQKSQP